MGLVQASAAERCGQCGRALLIPILREVPASDLEGAPRALARCAWCGARNVLVPRADPTARQRAEAISFVTRGVPRARR
jgi:hypothetical protein